MKKIFKFLKEVRREIRKITWLSPKQTLKLTLTVISISIAIGIFLQLMDITFQYIINIITKS